MQFSKAGRAVRGGAIAIAAFSALPAGAQTIDQRLDALTARIDQLSVGAPSQTGPGFQIAPNTRLEFYGYAKLDFIQDFDADLGDEIFGVTVIAPGTESDTTFSAHARQSRFGFKTYTDTSYGELVTRIEGDFFGGGSDGSGQFRLRHAYGEFGPFLIGQTWGLFTPIDSYPNSLDFQGTAGIPFNRPIQARYTHDFGNGFNAIASLERDSADSSGDDAFGGSTGARVPSLNGAVTYAFGDNFVKLAGIYRQLDGATETVDGYGINLSGHAALWEGGLLQASLTTGEAIGSMDVFGLPDISGNDALAHSGITIGITQKISPKVSIALVGGYSDTDFGTDLTAIENITTVHATVYYNPMEKVSLGVEFIYADVERFNGTSFDASRLQASAQFDF